MLATIVAPVAARSSTTWSSQYWTPGPCSPTALSMPCAVGWSRGAGLPAHSKAASDFVDDGAQTGEVERTATARCRSRPSRTRSSAASRARPSRRGPGCRSRRRGRQVAWDAVVLLQRCARSDRRPARSARPWTAASAASTVVTQLTPWRLAALRICSPSLRPRRPRGVLTTKLIVPAAIRSTAVTTCRRPGADLLHLGDHLVDGRVEAPRGRQRCLRWRRCRGPVPAGAGRRPGRRACRGSASERKTVPEVGRNVPAASFGLVERRAERLGRCPSPRRSSASRVRAPGRPRGTG